VQNTDFVPTWLHLAGLPEQDGEGISLLPCMQGLKYGNYEEVYLSEATWEVKRGLVNRNWKFIQSFEPDPHGRPMQELFDLAADPTEQINLAESQPDVVHSLKQQLDAWVERRLRETGRTIDPVVEQGRCGTRIGVPVEGETPGAGATPMHLRDARPTAEIPAPEALNTADPTAASTNAALDENTGVPLHGYVEPATE